MPYYALVVDDEPAILETFAAILHMHNFHVQTASSAATAAQKIQENRFDVVLTDMSMESSTAGFEVLQAAKALPHRPIVIIVSAFPDLSADWRKRGADAMFQKPTVLADLLNTVDELLKLRNA